MSRPDDAIAGNAGHPTGWPRPDQVARDPVTGRPLAPQVGQPAPQGYHYPGQEQGQYYNPVAAPSAPQYQPQTQPGLRPVAAPLAAQPGDYAPQFARYSGAPEQQAPQHGYAAAAYQPPQPQYQPAPAGQPQPGMDPHWPGERLPYQNLTTGEPRTYDPNSSYAATVAGYGADAGQQYAQPQGYADPNAAYQQQAYQPGYQDAGYGQGQYAPHDQGYDPRTGQPYAPADGYGQGYGQNGAALDPGQPISGAEGGYDGDYAEAPPRKRRGLMVAGALVCAVAVGGGLAFVYKTFGQSGKRIGPPPVVAKANSPTKVAPADPQGKQFDGANKKVLARLDEPAGGVTQAAASAGSTTPIVPGMVVTMPPAAGQATPDASGSPSTRTVQTVPIGRDGNPVGGQQAAVTPRGLPGVQIDNSLNPPPMRGGLPAADTQPAAAAPASAVKPQAQRLASAAPAAPADAVAEGPVGAQPKPRAKAAVPKAVKEAAAPPAGVGAAQASGQTSGGTGGYVAVLSSQKDRAAALRIYADLAQKYPDQLGNRQPEVQEANLGDKGVWQRLVVGPPSSQQSAKELCAQLKAAGHPGDCWAKAY